MEFETSDRSKQLLEKLPRLMDEHAPPPSKDLVLSTTRS